MPHSLLAEVFTTLFPLILKHYFRSAVTVGTVWGMDKAWFEEVGAFDERMERWGGENLDLAVRVSASSNAT